MLWLWWIGNSYLCLTRGHIRYRPKFSTVWCRRCGKMM